MSFHLGEAQVYTFSPLVLFESSDKLLPYLSSFLFFLICIYVINLCISDVWTGLSGSEMQCSEAFFNKEPDPGI